MVYISQTASRRCLLCGILFAILFTLMAGPQPVGATPALDFMRSQTTNTASWAGYVASSGPYTKASIYFIVPTLTPTPGSVTTVTTWGGVGGGGLKLLEAGVVSTIDASGTQTDRAFWEIGSDVSASPQYFDMDVYPKDEIWASVNANGDQNGYDGFVVTDLAHSVSAAHYESDPNTGSNTAECIVQGPVSNNVLPLAKFGTINITGCSVQAQSPPMVPIGNFTPSRYDMVSDHNATLASPGTLWYGAVFDVCAQNTPCK